MGKHEAIIKLEDTRIDKVIFTTFGILLCLTILSILALINTHVSAETTTLSDSKSATASVNVNAACTMSSGSNSGSSNGSSNGNTYTGTMSPGTISEFGPSTIEAICNDNGGYAIYAIGYSGNSYVPTTAGLNTDLILSSTPNSNIHTGTTTSGDTSSWSMKLSTDSTQTHVPTITNNYNNYNVIPTNYTKVAYYPNSTMNPSDPTTKDTGSYLNANYRVYVSPTQQPGTYTGAVRYTLVHPNMNDDSNAPNLNLYDTVASMSKGKQSPDDLRQVITADNSGVYEYDPATYGVASDANNNYPIYYYRGIIDSSFAESDQYGGIGSSGDGKLYPNYVRLGNDTCWRIVRTTGSGGVKMIYNGVWNNTDKTCAGAWSDTSIGSAHFNQGSSVEGDDLYGTRGFIAYVGYNYNDSYAYNNKQYATAISNNNLFSNEAPSNAKVNVENWYVNNMAEYTDMLERSAGWCNDRTTTSHPSVGDTTVPYMASMTPDAQVYFGSNYRNIDIGGSPSLNCLNLTGHDLLTVDNNYINYPIALLTEDEASLIGSGVGGYFHRDPTTVTDHSSNYSYESYLGSGSVFWLLSPLRRDADGGIIVFAMYGDRFTGNYNVRNSWIQLRPTISLTHSTTITSGSGTATDPWLIAE